MKGLSTAERFWPKVDVRGPGECWNWLASILRCGYGSFWLDGKNVKPHRVSWEMENGPTGLFVLHKCDNRRCVNPSHMFVGTQQDNMDDMVRKGRQCRGDKHLARQHPEIRRGTNNGRAVLNPDTVVEIRTLYATKRYKQVDIAAMYGITQTTVSATIRRRLWGHVQ